MEHNITFCCNTYSLSPVFESNFNNILDFYETGNHTSLFENSNDILSEDEFINITYPQYLIKNNQTFSSQSICLHETNTINYTVFETFKSTVYEYRNHKKESKKNFKLLSPASLIHFQCKYSTSETNIVEPTNILMFEFDNFKWNDDWYISSTEKEMLLNYFKSRKDCIAITPSISQKGFHFYLSVSGITIDNFESAYFLTLVNIYKELNFKRPIFDVTIGSKTRKDIWSQGIIYRNKNTEIIYDFNEVFKDEQYLNHIKTNHKKIKDYYTIHCIDGRKKKINNDRLIQKIEEFKLKDFNNINDKISIVNKLNIKTINETVYGSNLHDFMEKKCQSLNLDFVYTDDGDTLCFKYICSLYSYKISEKILKEFFILKLQENGLDFNSKIEAKYDEIVNWKKDKFRIDVPILNNKSLLIYKDDTTNTDTNDKANVIYLKGTEKINSEWIIPYNRLNLKADTKSGKTYSTIMARLKQKKINEKVVLIVPMVDIAKVKEIEFKKLDIKCQVIHGKNELKGYESVSVDDIDISCDLFLITLESYLTKLFYLIKPESTHIILDEIHHYLQSLTMKSDIFIQMLNNVNTINYKTISILTGTPIESEFYEMFKNYKELNIQYSDIKQHKIILKPKESLNSLAKRFYNDYKNGLKILFFNNSQSVVNPAMASYLHKKLGIPEKDIILIDSKHSILNYKDEKIIIVTSSYEMGVDINAIIDKIYVNPCFYNPSSLVSVESLTQIVNRTNRLRTAEEDIKIFIFTNLIDKEGNLEDKEIKKQGFIYKHFNNIQEISKSKTFESVTYFYFPIINLMEYKDDVYFNGYLKYTLSNIYNYLNINSFLSSFNNRYFIFDAIEEDEYNTLKLNPNEIFDININIKEITEQQNKEATEYFISKFTKINNKNNSFYDDILVSIYNKSNVVNINHEYIEEYIIKEGYKKTLRDLNVFIMFKKGYIDNNLSILYNLVKTSKPNSCENTLKELQTNKLFLNCNVKNINRKLKEFGIQLKLNRDNLYIMNFDLNRMIIDNIINKTNVNISELFSIPLSKEEIFKFEFFNQFNEMNFSDDKKWKCFLRYTTLNNLNIIQFKDSNNDIKYKINNLFIENESHTKLEWCEIMNMTWSEIKKNLKINNKQIESKIVRNGNKTNSVYTFVSCK
jgi:hypothetical protein